MLKSHKLYSKPQARKQRAFNRFPKTLFVLSFELNTAQPMRAMCIQSSPQDAIFDYLLNFPTNNIKRKARNSNVHPIASSQDAIDEADQAFPGHTSFSSSFLIVLRSPFKLAMINQEISKD